MRIKFIGYMDDYNIPWGTEFSVAVNEIQENYVNVTYLDQEIAVDTVSLIAIAPETVEDTLFLQSLRADVLSHSKILLGNVDRNVYSSQAFDDDLGGWLYENERWFMDDHTYKGGRFFWHYLVSEIIKAEGIPHYEAKPVFTEGVQIPEIGVFFCKNGEERLLEKFETVLYNSGFCNFTKSLMEEKL